MTLNKTDGGTGSLARVVIDQILYEYERSPAGCISQYMERELRVPVTETARNTFQFCGFHYIDIKIDDYTEGIPASFAVTVSESCHGGYEASLVCQTNLDEPDYAYWEFRDFLKQLAGGGYIGSFRMHVPESNDDASREYLHYYYKFPVQAAGNVFQSMIECVVSRFLNDLSHAAIEYFQLFFYHLPSHPYLLKNYVASGATTDVQRPECGTGARIIPFPVNRRNISH